MKIYKRLVETKDFYLLKRLFVLGIIILMSGCLSIKPGGVKSGKNLYETFFVGDEGTQYFIKPLTFKDETKNRLIIDFTFRYKDQIKDSAFVNISLLNTKIYRNIDSLKISNDVVSMVFKNIKYLFAERSKKEYNSRFSTKGYLVDINKLFDKNNWIIVVYKQNNSSKYNTPEETKKKIDKLKYVIFMLF